jgi:hypothetical protein
LTLSSPLGLEEFFKADSGRFAPALGTEKPHFTLVRAKGQLVKNIEHLASADVLFRDVSTCVALL